MMAKPWFSLLAACALLGVAAPEVEAKGSARITFTTTTPPLNTYNPNNVVAVWIVGPGNTHVRTLAVYAVARTQHLRAYVTSSGNAMEILPPDAISNGTRIGHGQLIVNWNLLDRMGNEVPDGTYTVRMEVAAGNANNAGQNNQGTFTFVKGPAPQTQTGLANGGFTNVSIVFDPEAVVCGDGVVDDPETCDPAKPGSCITSASGCAPANACFTTSYVGMPSNCTAACVREYLISECVAGDRCCPPGCTAETDPDCVGSGGGGGGGGGGGDGDGDGDGDGGGGSSGGASTDLSGGCDTGGSGGLPALALLGLAALTVRPRRRR